MTDWPTGIKYIIGKSRLASTISLMFSYFKVSKPWECGAGPR